MGTFIILPSAAGTRPSKSLSPKALSLALFWSPINILKINGRRAIALQLETVAVRRLEDVLGEVVENLGSARIFLKINIQGYDLEVFSGLGEKIIALQSEVSVIPIYKGMPSWIDSIGCYEKEGFQVVGLFPVERDLFRIIE